MSGRKFQRYITEINFRKKMPGYSPGNLLYDYVNQLGIVPVGAPELLPGQNVIV